MSKIEKGSIVSLIIQMVACAIVAMIIWPLLDLLYDAIFTHSGFAYSVEEHLAKPMIFGCIAGVVFWAVEKVTGKKK